MKQNITVEQARKELDNKYEDMVVWIEEHGYLDYYEDKKGYHPDNPFLSIGQMIEFLDEKQGIFEFKRIGDDWLVNRNRSEELCDALWEACKEVLDELQTNI